MFFSSHIILPAFDSLVELLYNRPTLGIELAGFVDPGQDGPALREWLLMDKKNPQAGRAIAGKVEPERVYRGLVFSCARTCRDR